MVEQVYRPRRPKESALWQCLCAHFYDFIQAYPEKYEKKYGFLKPLPIDDCRMPIGACAQTGIINRRSAIVDSAMRSCGWPP